ncbi:hypothetical protein [Listeria costaricensis]|uniref:hypothetical protein n=1 Tax=Listeria costaricensis TaxID=2026604 RepID=UPI001968DECA|nr:hypothetical protein [Listeria costaricensis]
MNSLGAKGMDSLKNRKFVLLTSLFVLINGFVVICSVLTVLIGLSGDRDSG